MSYWIFKVFPEQYRIDERLRDPHPFLICPVTRYQHRIQKGDTVFLWRASAPRGICAVMLIEAYPYEPEPQDLNDGYELPPGSLVRGPDTWAKGRLVQRFPLIEANLIKRLDGLELFSFFSAFQQAINYSVTRPEGMILMEFIEKHQAEAHNPPAKPSIKPRSPSQPANPASPKKSKKANPASRVAMLKCGACGRYVVSTDAERHLQENHAGQSVEWDAVK